MICGNQVSKSVINLQKWCPRIKSVGTQFSICWNLYSVLLLLAAVDVAAGDCASGKVFVARLSRIPIFANFRLTFFTLGIALPIITRMALHLWT